MDNNMKKDKIVDQLVSETWEPKQIIMTPVKFVKDPSSYSGSQANHWKNRESRNLADKLARKEELCLLFD